MALMNIGGDDATMTSQQIVDYINNTRDEGAPLIEHYDFMKKVPKVLKNSEKYLSTYKDSRGREQACYKFPRRESCLMAMSYSYAAQAAVYDLYEKAKSELVEARIQLLEKDKQLLQLSLTKEKSFSKDLSQIQAGGTFKLSDVGSQLIAEGFRAKTQEILDINRENASAHRAKDITISNLTDDKAQLTHENKTLKLQLFTTKRS